jgi:hypothetical protein
LRWLNEALVFLFGGYSACHYVDGVPFEAAYQQNLLTLVGADLLRIFPLEFFDSCSDLSFCFLQRIHKIFLELVPKHFPKSRHLSIIIAVFLDSVNDGHCPLDSYRL